jgi:hypothetical protein
MVDIDTTAGDEGDSGPLTQQQQKPDPNGVGRQLPIILTSSVSGKDNFLEGYIRI